jgi:hypothetical protein
MVLRGVAITTIIKMIMVLTITKEITIKMNPLIIKCTVIETIMINETFNTKINTIKEAFQTKVKINTDISRITFNSLQLEICLETQSSMRLLLVNSPQRSEKSNLVG